VFIEEEVEVCRLMVIIQDGNVMLILYKSVKDFLISSNELIIHKLRAHSRFAYRCIDYLPEYSNGEKEFQNKFIRW
jgi:hypothetical protein